MKTLEEKLESLQLSKCSDEPIHQPSFVQSFGYLVAVDRNGIISHVSENLTNLLDLPVSDVLGKSLLDIKILAELNILSEQDTAVTITIDDKYLYCRRITSSENYFAIELIESSNQSLDQNQLIEKLTAADLPLDAITDIKSLYDAILEKAEALTGCERAMLYCFDPDYNGQVIAERKSERLESYLHLKFPASDIPPQSRALYFSNAMRYIADANDDEAEIFSLLGAPPLDLSQTDIFGVSPFHIKYLRNMGVRGSFSLAVIIDDKLWGLIACHGYQKGFTLDYTDRLNLKRLSLTASNAIAKEELKKKSDIESVVTSLFTDSNLQSLLNASSGASLVAKSIMAVLNAAGLALIRGELKYQLGKVPELNIDNFLAELGNPRDPTHLQSITELSDAGAFVREGLAGVYIIPIVTTTSNDERYHLLLFLEEEKRTINWGGKHEAKTYVNSINDLLPRNSFAKWEQQTAGHSKPWTDSDIYYAQQLMLRLKEAALRQFQMEQSERYDLLESSAHIGLWTLDVHENYLYWNNGMFAIYGIAREDFKHTYDDWIDCVCEEHKTKITRQFKSDIIERRPFQAKYAIDNPKLGRRYIKAHASYLYDTNGNLIKIIGTNMDITSEVEIQNELKEQKEIAVRSNKLATLGELSASIGHEINNPLAVISSYNEIIKSSLSKPDVDHQVLKEAIDKSSTAIHSIRKIIHGLSGISRKTIGDAEQATFNVLDTINDTLGMLVPLYEKEGIKFIVKQADHPIYVEADVSHFQQILVNMLSNAKDAVTEQSDKKIELHINEINQQCVISILDNGCGISPREIDKIFESFFTTKELGKGTGIGLTMVKTLLESMSGTIEVQSQLDQGTEFTITIPAVEAIEFNEVESKEVTPTASLEVLLVDDNDALREVLAMQLEHFGYHVDVASDAKSALQLLAAKDYEVLITDSNMPGMSGSELLQKLYDEKQYDNMKRLLVTGDMTQDINQFNHTDKIVDDVVYKPFKIEEIINLLNDH